MDDTSPSALPASYRYVKQSEFSSLFTASQLRGKVMKFIHTNGGRVGLISAYGLKQIDAPDGMFVGIAQGNLLRAIQITDMDAFEAHYLKRFRRPFFRPENAFIRSHWKACSLCGAFLRKSRFARSRITPDKRDDYCLKCRRQLRIRAAIEAGDRRAERVAIAGGAHTESQWRELLRRFGNRCVCCGIPAKKTKLGKLTKDHVVPILLKGSDSISNIQPLCLPCNSHKRTLAIDYRDNPFQKTHTILRESDLPGGRSGREVRSAGRDRHPG